MKVKKYILVTVSVTNDQFKTDRNSLQRCTLEWVSTEWIYNDTTWPPTDESTSPNGGVSLLPRGSSIESQITFSIVQNMIHDTVRQCDWWENERVQPKALRLVMKDNRIWCIAALSPLPLCVSVHSMNPSASPSAEWLWCGAIGGPRWLQ